MKKIILSIAAFCIFNNAEAQLTSLTVGSEAPDFTLTDLDGVVHTKASFAGKYVLVDMFFTTCGPCQSVSPIVNQFFIKYGCNGFNTQVIAVETTTNNAATHAYEASYGGNQDYLTTTCSGTEGGGIAFQSAYDAQAFPTIIIIGPDGLIKNTDVWPVSSVAQLEAAMTAAGATLTANPCAAATNSIGEISVTNSKLYPNPSTGAINFEFESDKSEKISINVLNLVGQVLFSTEIESTNGLNKLDFNFAELKSGSYFFNTIDSEGRTSTQPFQMK